MQKLDRTRSIKNRSKRRKSVAEKLKSFNTKVNDARQYFSNRKRPESGRSRLGALAPIETVISPEEKKRRREAEEAAVAAKAAEEQARIADESRVILVGWDDKELEDALKEKGENDHEFETEASVPSQDG